MMEIGVIAYFSRHERQYCITRKEMLAVVEAITSITICLVLDFMLEHTMVLSAGFDDSKILRDS